MSGPPGPDGPGWRELHRSGSGERGSGGSAYRRSLSSLPVPSSLHQAHSYPGPDDEAGLLRKLLKRRSSGLLQQPQQPLSSAQLRRNRDKLITLLEEGQLSQLDSGEAALVAAAATEAGGAPGSPLLLSPVDGTPGDDELLPPAVEESLPVFTGRITIHCTAASYDLKGLKEHLETGGYQCMEFPDVLYSRYVRRTGEAAGDILLFGFGVGVFWDLSGPQEQKILKQTLSQYEEGKLSSIKVESETFAFRLVPYSKPSIQNDLITLSPAMQDVHLMKIAISFALAQSTKLTVLEEQAVSLATVTRNLPHALAKDGKVRISDKAVARLMGRVFIQQAALNLLGSVLDTPDFFWSPGVGDHMQSVYDKVWEYLEMEDRIEVLNARLAVLHELLDMMRLQGQAQHSDFLEVIIIVLICVDCVILLATLAATIGWIGGGGDPNSGGERLRGSLGGLLAWLVSWTQS